MAIDVPGRGPLGRPTLCDDHTKEIIFQHLSDGNYIKTACQAAGITAGTFCNWRDRAAKGEEPYLSFFEEMEKAAAIDEAHRVARIKQAGEHNFIADLAHLGRRYRDRWAENRPDTPQQAQQVNITIVAPDGETRELVAGLVSGKRLNQVIEGEALQLGSGQVRELGPGQEAGDSRQE